MLGSTQITGYRTPGTLINSHSWVCVKGNAIYLKVWAVLVQSERTNGALSPIIQRDVVLSINIQYKC